MPLHRPRASSSLSSLAFPPVLGFEICLLEWLLRFSFGLRLVPLLCPIFLSSSFPLLVLCRFSLVRLLLRIDRCCNCYLTHHNFRVSLAVPPTPNYLVVVSRAVAGLRFVTSGRKVPPRFFWLPVERLTNLPHVSSPLATSRWLPLKKPELSSTPPLQLLFALRCVSHRIASQTLGPLRIPPRASGFPLPLPASRLPPVVRSDPSVPTVSLASSPS